MTYEELYKLEVNNRVYHNNHNVVCVVDTIIKDSETKEVRMVQLVQVDGDGCIEYINNSTLSVWNLFPIIERKMQCMVYYSSCHDNVDIKTCMTLPVVWDDGCVEKIRAWVEGENPLIKWDMKNVQIRGLRMSPKNWEIYSIENTPPKKPTKNLSVTINLEITAHEFGDNVQESLRYEIHRLLSDFTFVNEEHSGSYQVELDTVGPPDDIYINEN